MAELILVFCIIILNFSEKNLSNLYYSNIPNHAKKYFYIYNTFSHI